MHFFTISRTVLRKKNISDKSCKETRSTSFKIFFFRKTCHLWDNVEKYCRAGQATGNNMTHAHCMLDTNTHTHNLCNTHCFSTAKIVAQTSLNGTLYLHCLSCSTLVVFRMNWLLDYTFIFIGVSLNPYPTAFPYGNGMVLHFYQQQESSTTKTVHKVINKGLKTYV